MPRRGDVVRTTLIGHAAALLAAAREPVTVRALAAAAGTSTMAVYTHFGGMPGLWRAVRQEGHTRLARRLADVAVTDDPVRDLSALGRAYVANALEHPDLYRTMFEVLFDLEDPTIAAASFDLLVAGAARARDAGRFSGDVDPGDLATRQWAIGHGLTSLVLSGALPVAALHAHAPAMVEALFVSAGDEPDRCRRSVEAGWGAIPP